MKIIKVNPETGVFEALIKMCFYSGITTNNVCLHPGGNRKLNEDGNMICGLATCVLCKNGSEDTTKCKRHQDICLPQDNGQDANQTIYALFDHPYSQLSLSTLKPDYFDVYMSIRALGYNIQDNKFSRFQILYQRVKDILEEKGRKKGASQIMFKNQRWKEYYDSLFQRKKPFRPTHIPQPFKDLTSTKSNINNISSNNISDNLIRPISTSSSIKYLSPTILLLHHPNQLLVIHLSLTILLFLYHHHNQLFIIIIILND